MQCNAMPCYTVSRDSTTCATYCTVDDEGEDGVIGLLAIPYLFLSAFPSLLFSLLFFEFHLFLLHHFLRSRILVFVFSRLLSFPRISSVIKSRHGLNENKASQIGWRREWFLMSGDEPSCGDDHKMTNGLTFPKHFYIFCRNSHNRIPVSFS